MKHEGRFASDPKPVKQERLQRGKRTTHRSGGRVRNPKAVILAPTRELALQIDRTVQPLARTVGLFTTQLVGGVPIQRQQHALSRGVDIVSNTELNQVTRSRIAPARQLRAPRVPSCFLP